MYLLIWEVLAPRLVTLSFLALYLLPMTMVVWMLLAERRIFEAEAKNPFMELPLRPPGESTRVKIAKLLEESLRHLVLLLFISLIGGVLVVESQGAQRLWASVVALPLILIAAAILGLRMRRNLRLRADYKLGFMGERAMGEELDQLAVHGYRVFHDVPFPYFNVDHIVVGPSGVYAVETRTRRRPLAMQLRHGAEIVYDGQSLKWLGKDDPTPVEHALRNSRIVARWLEDAIGEPIEVVAILAIPGWSVKSPLGPVHVQVLNGKHVGSFILGRMGYTLTLAQSQRLIYEVSRQTRQKELIAAL